MIRIIGSMNIIGKIAFFLNIAGIVKISYSIFTNYETFWINRYESAFNILLIIAMIYFIYCMVEEAITRIEQSDAMKAKMEYFEEWLNSDDPQAEQLRKMYELQEQFSRDLRAGKFVNKEEEKDDNEKDG
jgi:hypothetical protein